MALEKQPITLVTGLLGHGKTLWALEQAKLLQDEGMNVVQLGVNGCDPEFIRPLPCELAEWQSLPSGTVVIVDESHKFLPQRGPGKPPDWIEQFAETRHKGILWVLITQEPMSLDHFIRRRVTRHVHVERKIGAAFAFLYQWPRAVDRTDDYHERQKCIRTTWRYPKEIFGKYTSAKEHFIKPKLPAKLKLFFALPVVFAAVAWMAWGNIKAMAPGDPAAQTSAQGGSVATPAGLAALHRSSSRPASPDAYLEEFRPRVAIMPWSAPAWDDRDVESDPQLYCVIFDNNRCRCYTEQVTRLRVPHAQCMHAAQNGVYNPFRPPIREVVRSRFARDEVQPERGRIVAPVQPAMREVEPGQGGTESMIRYGGFRAAAPVVAPYDARDRPIVGRE